MMLDNEANAPLLIMSFVLHTASEVNLDKWKIKNTLSRYICIFIGEKCRRFKACYCHNKHYLSEAEIKWKE